MSLPLLCCICSAASALLHLLRSHFLECSRPALLHLLCWRRVGVLDAADLLCCICSARPAFNAAQ
jgi:hypothetical protein